jgi:hypothetical protein
MSRRGFLAALASVVPARLLAQRPHAPVMVRVLAGAPLPILRGHLASTSALVSTTSVRASAA